MKKEAFIKIGTFSLCDMGMWATQYQCGHNSVASAKRQVDILKQQGHVNARVVVGVCPHQAAAR